MQQPPVILRSDVVIQLKCIWHQKIQYLCQTLQCMWPLEPISFVKKHHSSFHRSSVDQRDPKIKARNWHFWCKNSLTYRSIVWHLQFSFSQFAVSPNHAVEVPVLKSHATVKSTVLIPGRLFFGKPVFRPTAFDISVLNQSSSCEGF